LHNIEIEFVLREIIKNENIELIYIKENKDEKLILILKNIFMTK